MTFTPINDHIEIEPMTQEGFVVEQQQHFEERGKVVSVNPWMRNNPSYVKVGDIVYFDSWLAAKLATGENDEQGQPKYRWLVKMSDVRAYETLSTE